MIFPLHHVLLRFGGLRRALKLRRLERERTSSYFLVNVSGTADFAIDRQNYKIGRLQTFAAPILATVGTDLALA